MDVDVESNLVDEFLQIRREDLKFVNKCNQLAEDIKQGSISILQLVEQLKTLLIDTVPENRQFGMVILYRVIKFLPRDLLTGTQLNFVCAFYSDRLNDHHDVIPEVLNGILALISFKNVPNGAVKQILNSLFKHVPCQQQQQGDRNNIYKILEICIDTKHSELQEMGFDFIYGVISAMDGERDPRNLLYLFQWLPKFLKNFTLGHLAEDMFEVLACYFPVDFKAPSNDPNSISRDSLANSLCYCLCAVPEFSEFCLPLVLEKLASSLAIAKLDSINVLIHGCDIFRREALLTHSTDIWHQICREVFTSNDIKIETLSLSLLEKLMHSLSQGTTEDEFQKVLAELLDTIKPNLIPNVKLFIPSCKLLQHTTKSCRFASNYVKVHFIPLLLNTYNMTTSTSQKAEILKILANLAQISYISDLQSKDLLIISNIFLEVISKDDVLCSAGLQSLGKICVLVSPELREILYKQFCLLAITTLSDVVLNAFLPSFNLFSQTYPEEIQSKVLEKIEVTNGEQLRNFLRSLLTIVDCEYFTEIVLEIFISFSSDNIEWAIEGGNCLRHLLELYENNEKIQNILVKRKAVGVLVDFILCHFDNFNLNNEKHIGLLRNLSTVCKIIIGNENSESQFAIVISIYQQINALYKAANNNPKASLYFVLFDALLVRLKREVGIKIGIIGNLVEIALNSQEEFIRQVGLLLLANILNKLPDDLELEQHLNEISTTCRGFLNEGRNLKNTVDLISYIAKALLMRAHRTADLWVQKLFDLLETNQEVIYSFKIIMKENCDSLNDKCFCIKKLLYRQKFFITISSQLKEKCTNENINYLLAFGYMVQETPLQVLILHFEKIMNLIVLTLDKCNDSEVSCAILNMLNILIQNKEIQLIENAGEFIPRLLKLVTFSSSMGVRSTALQCLNHYTAGYPVFKLLPFKQDVISGLTKSLDDRKRLVRKEAVETRLSWFMLDAPI